MKKIIVAIVLIVCNSLLAQVQFEAKVSKTTLGLNERLRIDFVMNMDGDNFNQPSFEGFRVIAGPSQQVSQSWVNGKSSFEKIYSYYLLPQQKGNLIIKICGWNSHRNTVEVVTNFYLANTLPCIISQPMSPNG